MYRAALLVDSVIYHQKCWTTGSSAGRSAVPAIPVVPMGFTDTVMMGASDDGVGGGGAGGAVSVLEEENKTEKDGSYAV